MIDFKWSCAGLLLVSLGVGAMQDKIDVTLSGIEAAVLSEGGGNKDARIEAIEAFTGHHLPVAVRNILAEKSPFPPGYEQFFLGYEVIGLDELVEFYRQRESGKGFFGLYNADGQFNISADDSIYLYEDQHALLDKEIPLRNLSALVPIFAEAGHYIVVNLDNGNELLVITYGYTAGVLAPDLERHITDLIKGLRTGRYPIDGDELIYPTSWRERQLVQSGMLDIDRFGNLY